MEGCNADPRHGTPWLRAPHTELHPLTQPAEKADGALLSHSWTHVQDSSALLHSQLPSLEGLQARMTQQEAVPTSQRINEDIQQPRGDKSHRLPLLSAEHGPNLPAVSELTGQPCKEPTLGCISHFWMRLLERF